MTGRERSRTQRVAAARTDKYDVISSVAGGSLSEQAGALRHGLSKALTYFEPELRSVLKKSGFLTRESRTVDVVHSWGCHSEPSPPQRKSVLHPRHRQTKGPLMMLWTAPPRARECQT